MKIVVFGSRGQLGNCIADQLSGTNYDLVYTSRADVDICDFTGVRSVLEEARPDVVINATAFTAVDEAEKKHQEAFEVNHLAVANIAIVCRDLDCWMLHYSTDYVFDGNSTSPYSEECETQPLGVYGNSKRQGEMAILESGCKYIIIRTAWVFSEYGENFLKTILRLGAEREVLRVVADQIGCPTYGQDLARATNHVLSTLDLHQSASGIYHYCGDTPCSWYEFAKQIFVEASANGMNTSSRLEAIPTSEYVTEAARPHYSVFDCTKMDSHFGIKPSDWRRGLRAAIKRL